MSASGWGIGWFKVYGGYQIAHYFTDGTRKALCGERWDRTETALGGFRYCRTCREKRRAARGSK